LSVERLACGGGGGWNGGGSRGDRSVGNVLKNWVGARAGKVLCEGCTVAPVQQSVQRRCRCVERRELKKVTRAMGVCGVRWEQSGMGQEAVRAGLVACTAQIV